MVSTDCDECGTPEGLPHSRNCRQYVVSSRNELADAIDQCLQRYDHDWWAKPQIEEIFLPVLTDFVRRWMASQPAHWSPQDIADRWREEMQCNEHAHGGDISENVSLTTGVGSSVSSLMSALGRAESTFSPVHPASSPRTRS